MSKVNNLYDVVLTPEQQAALDDYTATNEAQIAASEKHGRAQKELAHQMCPINEGDWIELRENWCGGHKVLDQFRIDAITFSFGENPFTLLGYKVLKSGKLSTKVVEPKYAFLKNFGNHQARISWHKIEKPIK